MFVMATLFDFFFTDRPDEWKYRRQHHWVVSQFINAAVAKPANVTVFAIDCLHLLVARVESTQISSVLGCISKSNTVAKT